jgi:hypothetical protein
VTGNLWSLVGGWLRQRHRACLVAIAVIGLVTAWWRYPMENHYSILRCTISFLGSPDAERNPHGWRFYQVGMTALILLLYSLVAERHIRLRRQIGRAALWSSAAISVSLLLILLVTWIPDSHEQHMFGMRAGDIHTPAAILAIPIMSCGILLDAVALWWSGVRARALWPFHLYGLIVLVGTSELMAWERMCRRDPTLSSFPGEGLHSTPLWEWIAFSYLVGFMIWMARGTCAARIKPAQPVPLRHANGSKETGITADLGELPKENGI